MTPTRTILALMTFAATASSVVSIAYAEESATRPDGYIALGAAIIPEYEGADASQTIPFIAARAEWGQRYIAVDGVTARANVLASPSWEFGPLASVVFGRDDDVESMRVARLAPLDDAFEVGAFVAKSWADIGVAGREARLEVRAMGDASDVYGGWQSTISASYAAPVGTRWRLGGEVSSTVVSDDYAETYFSVSPVGSVASGLPAYTAEGGVKDVGVAVNATYALNETWSVTGFAGYRRLLGDAADSPIVRLEGSPDQISAGIGLGYSF